MATSESNELGKAVGLVCVGALAGAGSLLADGKWKASLICAFTAAACILIVVLARGISELIQEKFKKPLQDAPRRRVVRGKTKKEARHLDI